MITSLYELINYNSEIPFIFSSHIYEYDIQKANINILLEKGCITEEIYNSLLKADRMVRQVKIGLLLQSNPKLVDILKAGIIEAKKNLFETNQINPASVLGIKNDAVFLINTVLKCTRFGRVNFVLKGDYTSYMKVFNIEMYYSLNRVNQTDQIIVKGIGDKNLEKHKEYFLDFLTYLFNIIETESSENVIASFMNFYQQYLNRELPIEYYRNFDATSKYRLMNSPYLLEKITDGTSKIRDIDISYNLNFLRQIYQYITTVYFEYFEQHKI